MTLAPVYKVCPVCHRRYLWNPGAGRMNCPNCGGIGKTGSKILGAVLRNVIISRKG